MYFDRMLTQRLLRCTARPSRRGGFTLVELLVVIGIIAILAGVALGPITNGIKQAKHNTAMQYGRQIGQMCFSYSTDNTQNGNAYPADTTAAAICSDLLNASYATDPSVFYVAGQDTTAMSVYTMPAVGTSAAMLPANCSWCFTCQALTTTGGITSSTSDLMPLVYFNNGPSSSIVGANLTGTPGTPVNTTTALGANAPFQSDGAAVFYKGNNAVYLKAGTGGASPGIINGFVSANCQDTTKYSVAQ